MASMMHAGLLPLACLFAVAAGFTPANPRAGGRLVGSRSVVPCDPAVDECPADSVSEHVDVPKSQSIRWRPSLEDSNWWLMRTESSTRQHAELSRLRLAGALALPSTDEVALDSRLARRPEPAKRCAVRDLAIARKPTIIPSK